MRYLVLFLLFFTSFSSFSQSTSSSLNDPEATALLKKVSDKYKSYKNVSAEFKLLVVRPKLKPTDDERKLTDTIGGKLLLEGSKFHITVKDQHIICDGKNIWTYVPADKEVQVNYFEETDDIFSPSKIFTLYKEGYTYQIKEKKTLNGKAATVIEMSPTGKKASYFKIDVVIDDASLQIVESKIYEKNGTRYIYRLTKQTPNTTTTTESFIFDAKKYPGVKVVDLR